MSSLHQGSLLTKPRCRPFPDATPVSDCAVCPSHSQGRGVSLQSGFIPPFCSAFAAISPGPYLSKSTCLCNCLFGNELVLVVNEMCYYSYGSYRCYEIQLGCNASTGVSWMYYFKDLLGQLSGFKISPFFKGLDHRATLSCDFLFFLDFQQVISMLAVWVSGVFQLVNFSVFVHCYALYPLSSIPAMSYIFGTLQADRSLNLPPGIFSLPVTVYL